MTAVDENDNRPAGRNRAPLYALLTANVVSLNGNWVTGVAIPWFVLQSTGSPGRTGLVAAVQFVAVVAGSLFGGVIVDRVGFKRASVVSDILSGLTVAAIPLIHTTVGIEFWQLLVLAALGAALDGPGVSARRSLVPELAKLGGTSLERANSGFDGVERFSVLVGPLVGGVLVALLGASQVLWVDAASFAVSAALIAFGVPGRVAEHAHQKEEPILAGAMDGLRFLFGHRLLRWMTITAMVSSFAGAPLFNVVLPVYAEGEYESAVAFGAMLAAYGGGSLLGIVLYGWRGHTLSRRLIYVLGSGLGVVPLFFLALTPQLALALAAIFIFALCGSPLSPQNATVRQELTPESLRGRVFGAVFALDIAFAPLGIMLGGLSLEAIGVGATLLAIASARALVALAAALNPVFADLDNRQPQSVEGAKLAAR